MVASFASPIPAVPNVAGLRVGVAALQLPPTRSLRRMTDPWQVLLRGRVQRRRRGLRLRLLRRDIP
jgi:hypothetical protein